MKREKHKNNSLNLLITVVGILLSVGGVTFSNEFLFGFGIVALLIYGKKYVNENFLEPLERTNVKISEIRKDVKLIKELNTVKKRN